MVDPEREFLLEAERLEEAGDLGRAFTSLLAGAAANYAGCQLNLGNFYAEGKGVQQSYDKAAQWYKKAFHNGISDGALNLAIDCERQGKRRSAIAWLRRAMAKGDGEACLVLAKLFGSRKAKQAEVLNLLRRAISHHYICEASREEAQTLLQGLQKQVTP